MHHDQAPFPHRFDLLTSIVALVVFLLILLPVFDAWFTTSKDWQGVPQTYSDEILYYAQIREVHDGHPFFGNPYFYEHREAPTLAFFATNWLAAAPLFLGLSFNQSLILNFIVWGFVFIWLCKWLLEELSLPRKWALIGSLFLFIQSYDAIFRASVRQIVFPFFLLYYIVLIRYMKKPTDRMTVVFFTLVSGVSFYIYGFLWQVTLATLFLVTAYAIWTRSKEFILKTFAVLAGTLVLATPMIVGTWKTMQSPFYWESMNRFGLVNTHLPTAEVVYSGGWVFIALFLLICLGLILKIGSKKILWFFVLTGLAMVAIQVSNTITGKELETAQHIRRFIIPWLALGGTLFLYQAWSGRHALYQSIKWKKVKIVLVVVGVAAFVIGNIYFTNFLALFPRSSASKEQADQVAARLLQQTYAAPLAWLDQREKNPVVVWSKPENYLTLHVPTLTKHYVLYAEPGTLELLSNQEIQERYLVSSYFENPSLDDLKKNMAMYAGRANTYHYPKTLERGIKICRLLNYLRIDRDCGKVQTPQEILGDEYFLKLEREFTDKIKPNIDSYLKKYNVAYIIKDKILDPEYQPEKLAGSAEVYEDGRYVIYQLKTNSN